MNKIVYIMKKIINKNRTAAYSAAAVLGCLIVFSVMIMIMPEGHAAGGTLSNPESLLIGENQIQTGKYYQLTCDYTVTETVTLDVSRIEGSKDVYVILKNFNAILTTDIPAIKIISSEQTIQRKDTPDANDTVNVHLILEGTNNIEGVEGAKEPLIKIENYSFAVETYNQNSVTIDDAVKKLYYSQNLALFIEESSGSTERNVLNLTTGAGSYGAAIGISESHAVMENSRIKELLVCDREDFGYLFNYGSNNGIGLYKGSDGAYPSSEGITFGAAPVTINSGVVNIKGNGYGAGIGNGGTDANSPVLLTDSSGRELCDIYGNPVNIAIKSNSGSVAINNGTVSVVMSENSYGSCFINGSDGINVASDGQVTIMGGSVYLKRQNNSTDYSNAVNEDGTRLVLYKAYVDSNLTEDQANNPKTTQFNLVSEAEDVRTYTVDNRNAIEPNLGSANATETYKRMQLTVVEQVSSASGDYSYSFNGSYHETDLGGVGMAYFYMPGEVLPRYTFTITNYPILSGIEFYYKTDMTTSYDSTNMANLASETGYERYASPFVVKQSRSTYLKITGVSQYCKGVTLNYSSVNDTSSGSGYVAAVKASDGNWYACINSVSGNITATFVFEMGQYTINYNYNLLPDDANANITNGNPTSANCGVTTALNQNVTWENHEFAGWYKEAECINPVEEVTSTQIDGSVTVYAKWKCKVRYVDDSNNVLHTEDVDYGVNGYTIYRSPDSVGLRYDADTLTFLGWGYNGTIYSETDATQITITKNTTFTANFKRTGYYMYITAVYNDSETAIGNYADAYKLVYTDADSQLFDTTTLYGLTANGDRVYNRTSAYIEKDTQLVVNAKNGYYISSITYYKQDSDTGVVSFDKTDVFSNTPSNLDTTLSKQEASGGNYKDIVVTIKFEKIPYSISYKMKDENGYITDILGTPNPSVYNVETETINLVEPSSIHAQHKSFVGWVDYYSQSTFISSIAKGSTGDKVLLGVWQDIPVYSINITTKVDGNVITDNTVCDANAFYNDVIVEETEAGDEVKLVALAGKGIQLKKITMTYEDAAGMTITKEKVYADGIIDMESEITYEMPACDVNVVVDFEAIQYTISYINLNGATNFNPNTYTVLDSFDLVSPVKDGSSFLGWSIITPDLLTPDENDVKLTPIAKIDRMTGNLLLTADWDDTAASPALFTAIVDSSITNGQVALNKNQAMSNDYIFVTVSADKGYSLDTLQYNCLQDDVQVLGRGLNMAVSKRSASVDISLNKLTEGVYYFVMPESDVNVTAQFVLQAYDIVYNTDGGTHRNATTYTIKDDVVLAAAEKEGYTFLGWYDEAGNQVSEIKNTYGNIVLTAKWEKSATGTSISQDDENSGSEHNSSEDDSSASGTSGTDSSANVTDRGNAYLGASNIGSGDQANISRLIIVCMVCMGLMILLIPKTREKEDEI